MLKLSAPEPVRIDLPGGAFALLNPIEPSHWMAARAAADALDEDDGDGETGGEVAARRRYVIVHHLVHRNLIDWEGIGGEDDKPLKPTRDQWFDAAGKKITAAFAATQSPDDVRLVEGTITRLVKFTPAFDAFEVQYAGPIWAGLYEKNGSAPSPDGSSIQTGATDIATAAPPSETTARGDAGSAPSS